MRYSKSGVLTMPSSTWSAPCGSGTSIATIKYDEYGIPQANAALTSAAAGRFQYTGQAWLPEIGLYYYKARMYSPTLGRFLQTDPIGYKDGINWYDYVDGDPINRTDPDGLASANYAVNDRGPDLEPMTLEGGLKAVAITAVVIGVAVVPEVLPLVALANIGEPGPSGASSAASAARVGPGPFSKGSIPAGPSAKPTAAQQRQINALGQKNGCHTCGTKTTGDKNRKFCRRSSAANQN